MPRIFFVLTTQLFVKWLRAKKMLHGWWFLFVAMRMGNSRVDRVAPAHHPADKMVKK